MDPPRLAEPNEPFPYTPDVWIAMSQQYLLPCPCGQKVTVQSVEAGQQVACSACGNQMEVPMLRELRKLPQVASPTTTRSARTDRGPSGPFPWARVAFVIGLIGMVITGGLSILMILARSKLDLGLPEAEMARRDAEFIDGLNAEQLWAAWNKMRTEGLGIPSPSEIQMNLFHYKQMAITLRRLVSSFAFFTVVVLIGLFYSRAPKPGR